MHQERQITNSNEARSVGAIALYPSGNAQHTWHFMSLNTGKRLHRRDWTPLPMSEENITRVHALAGKEGRSKVVNNFNFEWRPGTAIKEPPSEETSEDQLSIDEHTEESEDPDDEQTEQDGEPSKEEIQSTKKKKMRTRILQDQPKLQTKPRFHM